MNRKRMLNNDELVDGIEVRRLLQYARENGFRVPNAPDDYSFYDEEDIEGWNNLVDLQNEAYRYLVDGVRREDEKKWITKLENLQ